MSKKSIEKEFNICKKSLIHNRLVIAVKNTDETLIAFLKPICFTFREDMPEIPILMSKWRIENPTISAGMFKVTEERTISWLDPYEVSEVQNLISLQNNLAISINSTVDNNA